MRPRLVAVATHPIQYQAPWFQALAQRPEIDLQVLYVSRPDAIEQGRGFGVPFQWDVPLLQGYAHEFAGGVRAGAGHSFFARRLTHSTDALRRMRPDVVLLTGWHAWPLLQLLAAARRLRVPAIVRGDSNALRHRPALVRWLHRRLMRRYDAFLSVGRSNRDFYLACGVDPLRIFDAPHCVDNARFETLARKFHAQREALRERWGIPAGVTCFCYAGKLEAKKRIFDLLAALERAHAQAPMHLLVVGDGALLADARDFAAQRKLPVTFAGFLNQGEIPAAYAAADCLVLPSDARETWGLVVNEAMACGIAAIVSDRVGCAADLITPGATGEVFPLGDVGALASRLAAAAREPQRLREMGERARQRVCEGYSIERAVEGTVRGALSVAGAT